MSQGSTRQESKGQQGQSDRNQQGGQQDRGQQQSRNQGGQESRQQSGAQQSRGQHSSQALEMPHFEGAMSDLVKHLGEFAKENPSGAALWCFGIGFVLGWRLKPW